MSIYTRIYSYIYGWCTNKSLLAYISRGGNGVGVGQKHNTFSSYIHTNTLHTYAPRRMRKPLVPSHWPGTNESRQTHRRRVVSHNARDIERTRPRVQRMMQKSLRCQLMARCLPSSPSPALLHTSRIYPNGFSKDAQRRTPIMELAYVYI